MKKLLGYATAVIGLACTSCGNSNNLYPVSGTVTFKGQPAGGAAVFFHRQGSDPMNEHAIMGIVRDDGYFTLVCGPLGDGAPPGEYDVLILWRQDPHPNPPPPMGGGHGGGLARKARDRLKGRYADPKYPRFHALVKTETNYLPPFELTD
jgi:hypothetical protein